ncbi:NADH-ubiquinone oxidoreductase-F iron-sulfur binding region domain-containing protein [Leifsonia shinshuensis]|uniref:NADH:ubiquinone oxidoreductase subunit F (NADH-binding) n=1 Tax=Leifsonia shinshuensis TaxID=150026 RepID=A0A853CVJ3_9MICO|nr:NADH-ubiquinone oxidoreductase-F iron-sulfur binding region domain-containing protein [Leifsonia shinshuensis]NYJ23943.1 NADH:ubiquinone oxidoreductase subunit F (NADH-binding) [Leifsonia shinshuensis]
MTMTAVDLAPSDDAAAPPRLLAAGRSAGAAAHLAAFGPRRGLGRPELERELERSGLTGRGGAAFPAFRKLAATTGRRAPVVIGNGSEGEPWSWKDAVLLANAPHLVLDGLLTAADALGAARTVLYLHGSALSPVAAAIAERSDAGRVELVEAADGFVAGEASAVVNALQTGRAVPLDRVRRLSEHGLDGRPTLLHNVETLAQLALVDRYGGDWFRGVGDPAQPGTRLVTVTGDVAREGVFEVPTDTSVVDIVARAGAEARLAAAVLLGGYHGRWIAPTETGAAPGEAAGAGVVHVLGVRRCGLAATAAIVAELAAASARQCGPCLFGLPAMAERFADLAAGRLAPQAAAELARLAEVVDGRGSCHHPDGAARLVRSALRVFGRDVHAHAEGRCLRSAR